MKQRILFIFLLLIANICIAQIGFENNIIINKSLIANYPVHTISSDIDNDGDEDILVASTFDDKISWYENLDGQGNYGELQIISTNADGANSVFSADIDSDGDMDVVSTSSFDDKVAWYENLDGQGNFGSEQIVSTTANGANMVYGSDLDGDNDVDLIVASGNDDKIAWYENIDGQGNFGLEQILTTNADGANSVFSIDIDGDGDIDIVCSSELDDTISWFENLDGQASFGVEQIISNIADGATSVQASDIDNDGDIDIVSSSKNDNKIAIYKNLDGQGNFSNQQIVSYSTHAVGFIYLGDADGDNDIDIFSVSPTDNEVIWYENIDGQGGFGNENIIISHLSPALSVYVTDINGDSYMDAITTFSDDRITWQKNVDGQGNFEEQLFLSNQLDHISTISSGDIDNDGDNDIFFTANQRIGWYENLGNNNFKKQYNEMPFNGIVTSIYSCDIDGDNDLDLITGNSFNSEIFWYENDGSGNFLTPHLITNQADIAYAVEAGDVDGDGDLDVISASGSDNKIAWYENINGQGNFGSQNLINANASVAIDIAVADLDSDGDLDVISASTGDEKIIWYENINGQGTFGSGTTISSNEIDLYNVSVADLDNDGDLDILSSSENEDSILWFQNDGLGNFSTSLIISNSARSALAIDLDGDLDLDILARSIDGSRRLVWFENVDNSLDFGTRQTINNERVDSMIFSDINGNGKNDIIIESTSFFDDNVSRILLLESLGTISNEINGFTNVNVLGNGCNPSANILVTTTDGTETLSTFSLNNGYFQLFPEDGTYTTSVTYDLPTYYTVNPTSHVSNFSGIGNVDTVDFCVEPIGTVNDLNIVVYPRQNNPRPGFDVGYQIVFSNIGTTQLSGDITFQFDNNKIQLLSASETISAQTSNMLTFNFSNLNPFGVRTIDLEFNVFPPPTTNIDDVLVSTVTINPSSGDETPEDNVFELQQTVIGSYDPNDIRVLEGDEITIDEIDKYLHYIIRFQNTGTASAINVRVDHLLDSKLDWTTMQLENLSHSGRVEIANGSNVSFIFNNINLPDSTNDEPNSHGYIAFKIKPKNNVVIGDIINGVADIFFDFNPPITTNTVSTEIAAPLSVGEFKENTISTYPNPTKSILNIQSKSSIDNITVFDINGRLLRSKSLSNFQTEYQLNVSDLSQGIYFVKIQTDLGTLTQKIIKE